MKCLVKRVLVHRLVIAYMALIGLLIGNISCNNTSHDKSITNAPTNYITHSISQNSFTLLNEQQVAPIIISQADYSGVNRVAKLFQKDISEVSGIEPMLFLDSLPEVDEIVIVGSIDKNPFIKQLADQGKINTKDIIGKWENSLIEVVDNPFPNIKKALVITGSDKRGIIYAMFDVSRKIGVSPWYWWADVPVKKQEKIFVKQGRYNLGEPKVKYRGIFLNDEAPALSGWSKEKFGGFNHKFYENVFELILRLKGNYLWPAMWSNGFYDDDPMNGVLANEYGIVMGTSHHEPLGRAHIEWRRYGSGAWDYTVNKDTLDKFWQGGMERMNNWDKIVTIGMRGDGDESMSEETNTKLLERIVENQREIIEEVTGKPAEETPQLWALYKEVQEYYDEGMRVPDDVTLLLCDDNWGNVRKLPDLDAPKRKGGYGMYYHFDFVGGPRNYKWLNTSPIPRIWEQMNLCYQYGVDQIWIVNVGDLKPMELPISFFLDYAWNPESIPLEKLDHYTSNWAQEQFGDQYADQIANILDLYTKYNGRRTPELLYSDTYSLTNYREFETVTNAYKDLAKESTDVFNELPEEMKDAYYQLVHFPVLACSNLYELYYTHAKNLQYATQGRALTNNMADKVKELFDYDAELADYYHTKVSDGKWNHIMSQTHIGYTYWQQPPFNVMPKTEKIALSDNSSLGVVAEGSELFWPQDTVALNLPEFDVFNDQHFYVEIFNRGSKSFNYSIINQDEWIKVSETNGVIKDQQKIEVSIDWSKLKDGRHYSKLLIHSEDNDEVTVLVNALKLSEDDKPVGFIERNGYVSMEANNYAAKLNTEDIEWKEIPGLSKTDSGMSSFPVTGSKEHSNVSDNPYLAYDFYLLHAPENEVVEVTVFLSPTLNFVGGEGLKFALSVDDQKPEVVYMHEGMEIRDWTYPDWFNSAVSNKIITKQVRLKLNGQGQHTLKYFMINGGVILQKIVVNNGGLKVSYLGPPESIIKK
ncbi:glycosyl hydrolase 115 family protein [Plebeiibacterium sediminum]|uniref:Glycosyl hydrolase 115 family protein n=1 Tax=Plebeiibacterium sediminum TaxID=2992112 RepID=A0AAE3M2D4_9BACT|nr:glycosyl hydrolase 115 family protein [Plebeiobacterium sediminum]MCW3785577.1 glycosyl hydrolase 115 family protein [Plebeiobacterium sediminum]